MSHLSKKILIGICLVVSYLLTLLLSFYLTPPLPNISTIVAVIDNLRQPPTLSLNLPNLFNFPKIYTYPSPINQNNPVLTLNKITPNILPSVRPGQPTPTQAPGSNLPSITKTPTNLIVLPTITIQPRTPSTTKPMPTSTPKPSNTPKPTKTPSPAPIKLQALRPGKNFQDAARIIEPVICIPQAMIMAVLTEEYGPWMSQVQADWTNRNTYKGTDPGSTAPATQVMGVMQMMADTWRRIKPYVSAKLDNAPLSIDVTFDAMAGGGYHLRNISLAMQDHVSCSDWPAKYILYGACRYNGACAPGATTYNQYSYDVCNLYNQYTTGPKKNCH